MLTEPAIAISKWTVWTPARPAALRVMISFGSETGAAVGVPELLPQPLAAIATTIAHNVSAGLLSWINLNPPCEKADP
jgi:hypothetical protein